MAAPYYTYGGNLLDREKFTSTVNTTYTDIYGSNIRRYFSSIDAEVYFGDIRMDEMVAFDFIIEEKKLPIFGYNNFTPKRLLTGQKTIQGSFAINFTRTHNMAAVLAAVQDSLYVNEYEETQFYCSDDNQALFGKGFDITLSYGDHQGEGSYNSCIQTLIGCYITSYRQAFDTSGEPILDMYTFIAKDLLTLAPTEEVTSTEEGETTNTNSTFRLGPDDHYIDNGLDSDDQDAQAYYDEHKDDDRVPLCVVVRPIFTHVNGVFKITSTVTVCNENVVLEDVAFSITLNIPSLNINSIIYNLGIDKSNGALDNYFSYTMQGNQTTIGQKLKKHFEDTDDPYVECDINITCKAKETAGTNVNYIDFNMPKQTKLYSEKGVR